MGKMGEKHLFTQNWAGRCPNGSGRPVAPTSRPECSKRSHGDPFGGIFDFGVIFERETVSVAQRDTAARFLKDLDCATRFLNCGTVTTQARGGGREPCLSAVSHCGTDGASVKINQKHQKWVGSGRDGSV